MKLGEEYEKIVYKNDSASEKKCKEILAIISNDVTEQLKQGAFPTCTDLAQEWKQLVDKVKKIHRKSICLFENLDLLE